MDTEITPNPARRLQLHHGDENMGIQSTAHITRQQAIDRISKIVDAVAHRDYFKVSEVTFETEYDVESFVNEEVKSIPFSAERWTNKMLEDQMDKPFYRFSMFDNYIVKE